ncbi:MAG: L,D-transpeptidase [Thermoleophilia bacterium]
MAQILVPATARVAPRPGARARTVVRPTAPLNHVQRTNQYLLVTRTVVKDGVRWVELLLPMRPNGTRGWLPVDKVALRSTPYRIEIRQSARRLTLFKAGRVVFRAPVAVGKPATPTPLGRFFAVAERLQQPDPRGFLGPWVLALTGYSETLNEYAGGDGRVAIHGTSLPGLIGTRASHGCIRMFNADVTRLQRAARPGTPVRILR